MSRRSEFTEVENGRVARSGVGRAVVVVVACGLALAGRVQVALGEGCTANERQKLLASDGATNDRFGFAVSIDGDVAIAGAYLDDDNGADSGAAYILRFDGTNWNEEAKLLASDGAANDIFGNHVSISDDLAIVGAYWADNENGQHAGSAYVYRFDGSNWHEEVRLLAADGTANDQFGSAVTIAGDVVIVSASNDDHNGQGAGSVYVFRFDGSSWNQEAKLLASDGAAGDRFGASVSIAGDVVLAGAYFDDNENGHWAGSAYVFRFDGSNWNEEAKLLASDGAAIDQFGASVALAGDAALVGAFIDENENGRWAGSAYIFRFDGSNWNEEAKLLASDGAADDRFGISVSIDGDVAMVGSVYDDDNGTDSGSAYLFRFDGSNWNEEAKLLASDGAANDVFGISVSLDGDVALVGTPYDDNENGGDAGSVYVFGGVGDCNDNGVADICDIQNGTSQDENGNGIPDECEEPCDGDEVLAVKCKTKGCTTTLTGTLKNARPGELVTFRLNGDPCSDKQASVKGNGKAKAKYKALSTVFASGPFTIEVIVCNVSATTDCP